VTQDRSASGHIGYPHLATAEKGEYLLTVFHEGVVHLLRRMLHWDGESWEG
jgi:creatinine amidohydrolase/Fe(II)-dependent formamide hydrolase-like protein